MITKLTGGPKKWEPTTLSISFETEKEQEQFKEMIRHCDTVPDAIKEYGSKLDRDFVHDIMCKIYDTMD